MDYKRRVPGTRDKQKAIIKNENKLTIEVEYRPAAVEAAPSPGKRGECSH